jgi:hypothetical protein
LPLPPEPRRVYAQETLTDAGGDNAFKFHAGLVDPHDAAVLVIDPNDGVGADIFRPANEFAQNKVPLFSGCQAEAASILPMLKNTGSFEGAGESDTHDPASGYRFV